MVMMLKKSNQKDTYEVISKHEAFYTGGNVQVTVDGKYLMTTCRDAVKVMDMGTGRLLHTLKEEEDPAVTCFCIAMDNEHLVVASENGLLRMWDWLNAKSLRSWKSIHTGHVLEMVIDTTSTLLATGGSDTTIKVWDLSQKYWTHNLKGHRGVITCLAFHPAELWLCSAAMDLHIKIWDLRTSACLCTLEGHFSAVTCLTFCPADPTTLVSGGRDNVVLLWDLLLKQRKSTIPVFEAVESVIALTNEAKQDLGVVSPNDFHIITAGSKGMLRVWNTSSKQCVHTQALKSLPSKQEDSDVNEMSLSHAFNVPSLGVICTVTHERNIQFYSSCNLSLQKQFIGHNDEIMDVQLFGTSEEFLAVASNSTKVKVYDIDTFDSELLHGHTDLVVTLAVSGDGMLLISGSKDHNAILWKVDGGIHNILPLYTAYGHTQAISAVALPRLNTAFFLTASLDNTMKLWCVRGGGELTAKVDAICCKHTVTAHDRDINSIDVSPNDKLLVTASRDKTAKVWSAEDLSLIGVFQGHKRGIWKAKFSPVDQCVITASADGTLKIFALSNFTCVKTFEGHDSAVLNVTFVSRGMQFLSSDDAGLIKLWTIKNNEMVKSFDGHTERCWALTCNKNGESRMVSGGADSAIIIWKDVTEEKILVKAKTDETMILQQQELSNLLQEKRYHEALSLALTMERPFHSLNIIKEILMSESEEVLFNTVGELSLQQVDVLLRFCSEWNTNSKNCHEAQLLLNQVLRIHGPDIMMGLPNIKSILEGLLPYTERHYQRMCRLVQQTKFVEYTWQCMRLTEEPQD